MAKQKTGISEILVSKPLSRKQVSYAIERCKRMAANKKAELEEEAKSLRKLLLTDYDKCTMIRDGIVPLDVTRIKPKEEKYYSPRVVDCADFSDIEAEIESHNRAVEKALKRAHAAIDKRANQIIDRFELSEPGEALELLAQFDSMGFSL